MFSPVLLFSLCAIAVTVNAAVIRDSPITLPVVKRLHLTGESTIVDIERNRLLALRGGSLRRRDPGTANAVATNQAVSYVTTVSQRVSTVGIGSPPTDYTLIVDTGSSNTFVGAEKPYVLTSTSRKTEETVSVSYGSGQFSGPQYFDTVTLGELTIPQQGIADAQLAQGFGPGIDGILGIGPTDLTEGTLSPNALGVIPTVTDNAYFEGLISQDAVGVSFQPTTSESDTNGELTFGGADSSKYTGELSFVPITTTYPSNQYVGIDQSITYGSSGISILSPTSGIVDTGSTLLYLATDALERYLDAVAGSDEVDPVTGLYTISSENFANLESLFFHIGDVTYEFTANAQIWPRSLNSNIGGNADTIYLVVADNMENTGSGLDFINGLVWLERFYLVYDSGDVQVGFATTPYTNATSN
ncbi:acid protease [Obba rivulosa]|uniref:Acid protease n=1 Tax=Obba rivulosa TaxID=1052685 RepID=A0A8E2DNI3_9APHY|nr:acid protease [Obba rivulosa]